MRAIMFLVPALMLAGAASAQSITVAKGEWTVSTDVYLTASLNGQDLGEPPSHESLTECWLEDEEVTLDESMLAIEDCDSTLVLAQPYLIETSLSCNFDGIPMTGSTVMTINKDGDQLSGRMVIEGGEEGVYIRSEGIILGRRIGSCAAP